MSIGLVPGATDDGIVDVRNSERLGLGLNTINRFVELI